MAYSLKEFEIAFGGYLGRFKDQFVPYTKGCVDWKNRPLKEAAVYAQGRLVDDAEGMIAEWRKNDNHLRSSRLPVVIVGMGRDYTPSTGDYTKVKGDPVMAKLPGEVGDTHHEFRAMVADRKVQALFVAANEPTMRSMALQFTLFLSAYKNRRFYAEYDLQGEKVNFPCVLESPEVLVSNVDTGQKNLVMSTVDMTFREQFPIMSEEAFHSITEIEETNIHTEYKRLIDSNGVTRL